MVSEQKISKEIHVNLLWSLSTEKKNGKKRGHSSFSSTITQKITSTVDFLYLKETVASENLFSKKKKLFILQKTQTLWLN